MNENPQDRFMKVFNLKSVLNEAPAGGVKPSKLTGKFDIPELKKVDSPVVLTNIDDILLPPVHLYIPLKFGVVFNTPKILEDYGILAGYEETDVEEPEQTTNDEPIPEPEPTDADIAGTSQPEPKKAVKVKKYKIDYNSFYSVVKRKLSATNIQFKLREQVRAGVFKLGNFEVGNISYINVSGAELSVATIYKNFVETDKTNEKKKLTPTPITVNYGIEFTLVSKDNMTLTPEQIESFVKQFAIEFDKYVLADDEHIQFSKSTNKAKPGGDRSKPPTELPTESINEYEDESERSYYNKISNYNKSHGNQRYECPTCHKKTLTPYEHSQGYQCNRCADRDEGKMDPYSDY